MENEFCIADIIYMGFIVNDENILWRLRFQYIQWYSTLSVNNIGSRYDY